MKDDNTLDSHFSQIDTSRGEEIRKLVNQVLEKNPDSLKAWSVLARVSKDPLEKIHALNNILRLKPDEEWAKKELDKENLAHEMDLEALKRANSLAEKGETQQAEYIIDFVLGRNPDYADAWFLKAKISTDEAKTMEALREVIRINPTHKPALDRLAYLQGEKPEDEKEKTPIGYYLIGVAGLFLVCGLITTILGPILLDRLSTTVNGDTNPQANIEATLIPETRDCREVINQAMEYSDISCRKIGSNEVCYGNSDIYADLVEGFSGEFATAGDVITIEKVRKLSASPLDMEKELWGIAILKIPANLPGTLPGQNVTFMVFGDTAVNNTSGNMTAFYFASGITGISCAQIPFNGLFIESQDGQGIAFQANGVDFILEGKSVLNAQPDEKMTITLLEGSGSVSAEGKTQDLEAGSSVSVPLDWDLNATGPPSEPVPLSEEDALVSCYLLGIDCPTDEEDQPPTFTPVPVDANLPTNTPVPIDPGIPTNTSVPVPTGQPTNTPVPLPTNTSAPLPTNTSPPVPTNTIPGPTNTPVPGATATNTPLPTNTTIPPTATNTPTNTAVPPTATNTPVPPTPTTSGCSPPHPVNGFVTSIIPTGSSVPVTTNSILVQFNQSMDQTTVEKIPNYLFKPTSGGNIAIDSISYNSSTYLATLSFSTSLSHSTEYSFTVKSSLANNCSTTQDVNVEATFTVEDPP